MGTVSSWKCDPYLGPQITRGILQGVILSPLLFNILSDLSSVVTLNGEVTILKKAQRGLQ